MNDKSGVVDLSERDFASWDEYEKTPIMNIKCKPTGRYYVYETMLGGENIAILIHPDGNAVGKSDTKLHGIIKNFLEKVFGMTKLLHGESRYDMKIKSVYENAERLNQREEVEKFANDLRKKN